MTALSILSPAEAFSPARPTDADTLVDSLVARWDGDVAPPTLLGKAARLHMGFTSRHALIRQDRQFVASAAWLFAFVATFITILMTSGLVELLIAGGEKTVRLLVTAALLGLVGCCLSRRRLRLPVLAGAVAAFTAIIMIAPATAPGLAEWDIQIAFLAWAILATKAVRYHFDRQLDRAEARLLLQAAGCRV